LPPVGAEIEAVKLPVIFDYKSRLHSVLRSYTPRLLRPLGLLSTRFAILKPTELYYKRLLVELNLPLKRLRNKSLSSSFKNHLPTVEFHINIYLDTSQKSV
jgi:hypothetical protein